MKIHRKMHECKRMRKQETTADRGKDVRRISILKKQNSRARKWTQGKARFIEIKS